MFYFRNGIVMFGWNKTASIVGDYLLVAVVIYLAKHATDTLLIGRVGLNDKLAVTPRGGEYWG